MLASIQSHWLGVGQRVNLGISLKKDQAEGYGMCKQTHKHTNMPTDIPTMHACCCTCTGVKKIALALPHNLFS
jgi:hypothetical protein